MVAVTVIDSILSLESFGNGSFSGGVVGGGGADLSVAVGTGDWLNLQSLELSSFGGGAFSVYEVQMDNIVVSGVVPIPAAVWLFGSALAGLGWIRRQRKA